MLKIAEDGQDVATGQRTDIDHVMHVYEVGSLYFIVKTSSITFHFATSGTGSPLPAIPTLLRLFGDFLPIVQHGHLHKKSATCLCARARLY